MATPSRCALDMQEGVPCIFGAVKARLNKTLEVVGPWVRIALIHGQMSSDADTNEAACRTTKVCNIGLATAG